MTSRSDATKEQIINLTHLIVLFQSSSQFAKTFFTPQIH